jgi:PAS domain S-box-containing protein
MGLTRADVLGRIFWEVGWLETGDTVPQVQAMIAAAARGETARGDILARFPGVGRRDVEVIFAPMRAAAGQVINVVGFGVDITERKQAERNLRLSETRYRRLHESMTDAFVQVDMTGRIVECNRTYQAMLGYAPEEILRLTYVELTPERWHEFETGIVREQILPRGYSDIYEKEYRRRDGTVFPVELRTFLLRDDAGAPVGMWAIVRDIKERRRAEQVLRESQTRLNEAQRIAKVGSWELDLVTNHLHWSPEIFRLFEIDPTQFGASYEAFLNAIHPEDREAVNAAYTSSLKDRQPYCVTHRLLMADGRIKYVEEQCETDFAANGKPLQSRGTVQDVTERVLAEETIRCALHEKEILLREIHHRVKNNLQIVSSLLHFQAKKVQDAQAISVFGEARLRLRSMILVHEKLYNSRDLSEVDFADYVRSLVGQLAQSFAHATRHVRTRVETAPVMLHIESALPCGMILAELITNVFKYAFPEERSGEIVVRLAIAAGRIELMVADNGAGLPAGFDPETARSFGWQLIRNLTEQLDGAIVIQREAGTCVTVSFPLHQKT